MKAKILETFASIQGEGTYAGVKQVFIRFFECNMHCVWCDTPHSIGDTTKRFEEFSISELDQRINELWSDCHSVSLTGGEPLIQKDFIKEFLPYLRRQNKTAYLETNGVFPQALEEIVGQVDIIAMDIKLPSSTECKPYWQEHKEFLKVAVQKDVFIKTVISSRTDQGDIEQAIDLVSKVNPELVFILQPNYFDMGNGVVEKCQDFQKLCFKKLKNVRIMPQVHKFMKLR